MIEIKNLKGEVIHTLQGADLRGAYLPDANLRWADLQGADLQGAYLPDVDLQGANLQGADLQGAYLQGADLQGAYLPDANLRWAYLQGADLRGADLRGADLPDVAVCPDSGAFTAWKLARGGAIIEMEIPADARRNSSLVGRKCRAERAIVKSITLPDGTALQMAFSLNTDRFVYRVGEVATPDGYDDDIRVECTHGIHFYITRREAERHTA